MLTYIVMGYAAIAIGYGSIVGASTLENWGSISHALSNAILSGLLWPLVWVGIFLH